MDQSSLFALSPIPEEQVLSEDNIPLERNNDTVIRPPNFPISTFTLRFKSLDTHPYLRRLTPDTIELTDPVSQVQFILHVGQLALFIEADTTLRHELTDSDLLPVGYVTFVNIFNATLNYQRQGIVFAIIDCNTGQTIANGIQPTLKAFEANLAPTSRRCSQCLEQKAALSQHATGKTIRFACPIRKKDSHMSKRNK